MASSSNKPTPRRGLKNLKSPNLLESSFDIDKPPLRPNSTIGTPTYFNKFHSKSSQLQLKRTRSNSSLSADKAKIPAHSDKSGTSPLNLQQIMKGSAAKDTIDLRTGSSTQFEKTLEDENTFKNKKKNQSLGRLSSSNGFTGNIKHKGSQQLLETNEMDLKNHQTPMQRNTIKREESAPKREASKEKSHVKELSLGYSRSVSYGVVEHDLPPSTQRLARAAKKNIQTPVFVIDCEIDLKEANEGLKENLSRHNTNAQTPTLREPDKSTYYNNLIKKASRGNSGLHSDSKTGQNMRKTEAKGKENEREGSLLREKEKEKHKLSHRVPSFFNKKLDSKPPTMPLTTKAAINRREDFLHGICNRQSDGAIDPQVSSRILNEIRPTLSNSSSNITTPKNYFMPKSTTSANQRNPSPSNSKTPRVGGAPQTQYLNTEEVNTINPSKNSGFSFKMLYFKPIEDSKIDEFIRDVNESYQPKKTTETDLSKTIEKNRNMTEPAEPSFSTPLASNGLVPKPWPLGGTPKERNHNSLNETMQRKTLSNLKKSLNMENKTNVTQESLGKPPKPRSNYRMKEERQSTNECPREPERASSPSFESKKGMMSAEKPKVKDSNTKIESKNKTTYSKLDKLLQEIKNNPSNKENNQDVKLDPTDLEKELFSQSSKAISSSSSTNCSLNGKSYAHTLMRVTGNA